MTSRTYRLREIAPPIPSATTPIGERVWLLNLDQIEPHTGTLLSKEYVQCSAVGTSTHAFDEGNVLYSKLRPYLNKVLLPDAAGYCTSELVPLRPNQELVTREYLAAYLRSFSFLNWVCQQVDGAKMPRVSMKVLWEHSIELPTLDEQKRITAILQKSDMLRSKRQETIRLTDEFLRAVFIDMFGVPGASCKWPESFVANMVSNIESGWSAPSSDRDLSDQDLAVLKVSAVSTGWFLPDEAKPVDREMVDRPLVFPRRGDLLFSRANTRELVAACCLVEEDVDNRFLPDKLWRVTADPKQATNEYLCYLFRHPAFRHELTKQATGTSGSMLNISQAKLLSTPAPLPPVALQQKFTKIVNRSQLARRNSLNSLRDLQSLQESLTAKLFG